MFLKIFITEFDDITITHTGQNSIPLEIEDKVNLTLLINEQNDMLFYRTKKRKICQKILGQICLAYTKSYDNNT